MLPSVSNPIHNSRPHKTKRQGLPGRGFAVAHLRSVRREASARAPAWTRGATGAPYTLTVLLPAWFELIAFVLGLAFGSFLNVCISRLPKGESIVTPRSR